MQYDPRVDISFSMHQFLRDQRDGKLEQFRRLVQEGPDDKTALLEFERQWWEQFIEQVLNYIPLLANQDIIERTISLQNKVQTAMMSIQESFGIQEQVRLIYQEEDLDSDQQGIREQLLEVDQRPNKMQSRVQNPYFDVLSQELARDKETLEACQRQNTQLTRRLVKSLERCALMIQKVDKLKLENNHLQSKDSDFIKHYEKALMQNKKELQQKDCMIRLYEDKLQLYEKQRSPRQVPVDRPVSRNYAYTSQGIIHRIQTLRQLAQQRARTPIQLMKAQSAS